MSTRRRTARSKSKAKKAPRLRLRLSLKAGCIVLAAVLAYASVADWFVHHPREWLENCRATWPNFIFNPLYQTGNAVGDFTDSLGWTGSDAVYEYDEEAPEGEVLFAGEPRRMGLPAPTDIVVLDRGEFKIGWSPSLRHPVWCAYHVPAEARFPNSKRPSFIRDRAVPSAPNPNDYTRSGFDRGHMVPNYAIVTRFGPDAQRKTFQMSNIAPQTENLNRGVWRDIEHRIAELWTARYGEIWVIVGGFTLRGHSTEIISGPEIEVPEMFYQIIVAQEGLNIRALAVLFDQVVPYGAYAARHIVSIDELEDLTGLDFLPDLPSFIQSPLESERPTRLWPIRFSDALKQFFLRYTSFE